MPKLKLKTLRVNNNMDKTVEECYKEYIDYCKSIGQRQATLTSKNKFYTYELTKLVNPNDSIQELTKGKIEKYVNKMIDSGYKGNYYQTFVIKLRAFLTYCFTREYLIKFDIRIPQVLLEKKQIYTEGELNKLLKKPNLNTCVVGDYRSWVIVNFFLATGCRTETLLNIRVKDINFSDESVLFRHMKTKRQINVPLSLTLKNILREYITMINLKEDDILFSKLDGAKMNYDTLHQNLCNYFRHTKVKMRGVNTFRNTFATMFIKNGGDIYRLKILLGHSNIKTTERYVNLLPLEFKEDLLKYNPLDILSNNNKKLKMNR